MSGVPSIYPIFVEGISNWGDTVRFLSPGEPFSSTGLERRQNPMRLLKQQQLFFQPSGLRRKCMNPLETDDFERQQSALHGSRRRKSMVLTLEIPSVNIIRNGVIFLGSIKAFD